MGDTENIFDACLRSSRMSPPTQYDTGSFDQYDGRDGRRIRIKAIRVAQLRLTAPPGCYCPQCIVSKVTICYVCENPCDTAQRTDLAGSIYYICADCFNRLHSQPGPNEEPEAHTHV